jgi:ubiquinone/menaquinone biosynthesis C-methylase UbiE
VTATQEFWEDRSVVERYGRLDELFAEEVALLDRVRDDLPTMRMLDIGVGAGRTTAHFAPLAGAYVGVDLSQSMISACRERFAASGPRVRFEVADVRAMPLPSDSVDFALFSYNGLDYLLGGPAERLAALQEIQRVCAPGALLALSTHNLGAGIAEISFRAKLSRARTNARGKRDLPRRFAVALGRTSVLRLLNASPRRLARLEHAALYDYRHGLRPMRTYYMRPTAQLRELSLAGFADACALTAGGEELRDPQTVEALPDEWVHYLAWKRGSAGFSGERGHEAGEPGHVA